MGRYIDRYVYAFGRDRDGDVYVCTNQEFRPESSTGMVHRIVPAGEGTYTEAEETTLGETPTKEQEEETTLEEETTDGETTNS